MDSPLLKEGIVAKLEDKAQEAVMMKKTYWSRSAAHKLTNPYEPEIRKDGQVKAQGLIEFVDHRYICDPENPPIGKTRTMVLNEIKTIEGSEPFKLGVIKIVPDVVAEPVTEK